MFWYHVFLQNCLFILKICPYFFQISLRSISPFCSLSGFSACSRRVSSRNFHPHEGFQCPSRRGARSWRSLGDIKPGNLGDETMKAADWAFFDWNKPNELNNIIQLIQLHTRICIKSRSINNGKDFNKMIVETPNLWRWKQKPDYKLAVAWLEEWSSKWTRF